MLNKFAVIPEHGILATKDFKPQTHVLEVSDLEATRACIEAFEEEGSTASKEEEGEKEVGMSSPDRRPSRGGLLAFFNSGEHSGASQSHRHIQLLPVERMRDGLEEARGTSGSAWTVLADQLDERETPFLTFSERVRLDMSAEDIHKAYLRLYRRACRAVAMHAGRSDGISSDSAAPMEGEARISYNLAMTRDNLVICPRLAEGAEIRASDGSLVGAVALNGTVLAGTALVKNEAEWDALREDPEGLLTVLRRIGVPRGELDESSVAD